MSDEKRTVRFAYSSSQNITFYGTIDTGISYEEWAEMSASERDSELENALYELVDIWVLGEDEADY